MRFRSGTDPILILGSKGQLGRALLTQSPPSERAIIGWSREDFDFSDIEKVSSELNRLKPSIVINASAYTAVDAAEGSATEAEKINGDLPRALAQYCAENQALLVHYSTDYVFSGEGQAPWKENDPPNPLNNYGVTKLSGERAIAENCKSYFIFRTSWVFDNQGKNFVTTMLRLAPDKDKLAIVNDQVGAPTYSVHLAQWTWTILSVALNKESSPFGIYHLCASGTTTWFDFAQYLLMKAKSLGIIQRMPILNPISTEDYAAPTKRPKNSRLDCSSVQSQFDISLAPWQEGIDECLKSLARVKN